MPINAADTCRTYILPKLYSAELEETQISERKSFTEGGIMRPPAASLSPYRFLLTVLDIALDCGFGDVSNFNRAFRSGFGASPSEYRRQQGGL